MKILLLVTSAGYSFTNQATALQAALAANQATAELLIVNQDQPNFSKYKDYVIIPIGAWNDFDRIVRPAVAAGCTVLPWLVADDTVQKYIPELNELPLLLTTSQHAKEVFVRDGVRADNIRVLYECVDEDIWQPPTEAETKQALQLFSIDEDMRADQLPASFALRHAKAENIPILLTFGKTTAKGSREIMQALAKLDRSIPWIYILKGWPSPTDFSEAKEELELAHSLGIEPRIRYISGAFGGTFMQLLMQLCDVYVSAAHIESFGLPLVEAQYCGKPVVTHKATASQETVQHEKTGLIAQAQTTDGLPHADTSDLARHLERILTDQALRQQLAGNARASAVERFGKQTVGKQCLAYIEELATHDR